jgi:putative PIN family toxin of toxin-antitoxin system
MMTELVDALTRPKFIGIKSRHVNRFLSILVGKKEILRVQEHLNVIAEDPDDNIVLSTACQGNADFVVTEDKHLLNLKEFRSIRMITVKEMLELLDHSHTA